MATKIPISPDWVASPFFVAMHYFIRLFLLLISLLLVGPAGAQVTELVGFVSLPFDLVGGLVVLRNLELNGQHGDFIFDTGCAYSLLVEQRAFAGQLRGTAPNGLGVGGNVPLQQLAVTSFRFGAAHYTGIQAVATSLAQVRGYVGPRLLGLVGTGLLRNYEVVIDYQHRRLSCYPFGMGHPTARPFVRGDSLAFTLEGGWPVVNGYIGITRARLLLDTGAVTNSLDLAFVEQLAPTVRPRRQGRSEPLTGLGGRQQVQRAILRELHLPPTAWLELPFTLIRLAKPTKGPALPYQGILGYPFLVQDGLISFHYGRHKFYALTPTHP